MHDDVKTVLLTEEEIGAKVQELGLRLSKDYAGRNPVFITVLKGAVVFMADLIRQVDLPCEIDFMVVSSYGARVTTSGNVKVVKDIDIPLEGRDVVIVEDILDSGVTLSHLKRMLEERGPASVRIVTLLDKPARRTADIRADYVGFVIPDEFVIGYGLDYDERYRNLPYIGVLKPEVYSQ